MANQRIHVPESLVASHRLNFGASGDAWITALPSLAEDCLDRWRLRLDGPPRNGAVALVLPVVRADGTPAALKLQPVDDETVGEPVALRAWAGRGAVALLEADPRTGSMLLQRLDATRSLLAVMDDMAALRILSELLARLVAVPAPAGLRKLSDVAATLLDRAAAAQSRLPDRSDRRLVEACAASLREVLDQPGDRLLHWDLHYDNVLAAPPSSGREEWLAIDPKPLAGDPGFDLYPALWNRWDEVEKSGDVARAVRSRFDLMTDVLALDRRRAARWTLGRALQVMVWTIESGETHLPAIPSALAHVLLNPR